MNAALSMNLFTNSRHPISTNSKAPHTYKPTTTTISLFAPTKRQRSKRQLSKSFTLVIRPVSTRLIKSISVFIPFLAPVVRRVDSAIHRINHYSVDNSIGFASVYPLYSDLSSG